MPLYNDEDDYYDIYERKINMEILAELMPALDEVIDRRCARTVSHRTLH